MRRRAAVIVAALAVLAAGPDAVRQPGSGALLVALLAAMAASQLPALRATPFGAQCIRSLGPATAIVWMQIVLYPLPGGVLLLGVILGMLSALVALGMALVYRANRILNFAQADLGSAPTVLAVSLIAFSGLNYVLGLLIGLAAAVVLGIVIEFVIIRRFFAAPRLILTVATIGLSQLLTVAGVYLPRLWDQRLISQDVDVPGHIRFTVKPLIFTGDHLLAMVVVPLMLIGLAVFLRRTDVGIAVRASAERADLARLVGVPVKRLHTIVWSIATVLSFTGVFLRAGIIGLPTVSTLSFGALLTALAALMLGRLTDLPAVALSAVALGALEQGIVWNNASHPELVYPIFGGVVLVALLLRRTSQSRADADGTSTWEASTDVRPIPAELRRLPEVRLAKYGGAAVGLAALVFLPVLLGPSQELKAASVAIFAVIALSIVVLTGWAGQVSLGQMSFVAVGAVVGATATREWGFDLSLATLVAGAAGAGAAVLVGLPALRLRGLFLAVTTLAFAVASGSWLLNRTAHSWVPDGDIPRPLLFGHFALTSQRAMYEVSVGFAVLALVAVHGLRRSRTGRVLVALRDNERGVQAYGIGVTRAKLSAFAISGFLAASAGCIHVHLLGLYSESVYGPGESFGVFTASVVGGLGTLTGAVLGAVFLNGGKWFLTGTWQLLPSSLGVLVILLVLPGGLGDLVYQGRDALLRKVAARRGLHVPSLAGKDATAEVAGGESDEPTIADAAVLAAASIGGGS